jgi:hypothetical protein
MVHSATLVLSPTLDSLFYGGTLIDFGSLYLHETFGDLGSLTIFDTLIDFGSLYAIGTLYQLGSSIILTGELSTGWNGDKPFMSPMLDHVRAGSFLVIMIMVSNSVPVT